MRIIVIEDEPRAASHLERLLKKVAPEMTVIARLESVREGLKYLQNNPEPDLIFSDIQLADGLCFEIFNQWPVRCPIIFTTAYDHYALEAFKTSGLDYLLKPIEEERLHKAIVKTRQFSPELVMEKLLSMNQTTSAQIFKSRFMVKVGDKIKSIPVEEISLFFSQEKATYLFTKSSHNYNIEYTLDQLEQILDPQVYFRISRKYIVSIHACTNIMAWTNSRLRLRIEGSSDPDIFVARERVQEFKNWLDR